MDEARQGAKSVAANLNFKADEVETMIFALADAHGNIAYKRFLGAMIQQQKCFDTSDLWARFCDIDQDRSGALSQQELVDVLKGMGYPAQEAISIFQEMDVDGGG